ncbi:hypothetical protein OCF65_11785 [Bacillus toyonensis]|uniref:hypothetical protein n=1 Tax=Bacillus TaxID=1386 RepID=UPI0021D18AB1|nr:hypothetical protein [Bacillus toyonensis]MCU4771491.1 hypothetical protein [Bacillus toyonensis]MCU5581166.1 hypothetical protein [Bacillus toyonensis]
MEKKMIPWYLKSKFIFFICFIIPVIGFVFVYINRNNWESKEKISYFLFALTNLSLNITVLFFTRDFWVVTIHLIINLLIIIFYNSNKRLNNQAM